MNFPLSKRALALLGASLIGAAHAQTLTIGLASEPTAADPHYHKMTTNDSFSAHVYDSLVGRTASMELTPSLATSWKNLDDLTWEFKLRKDVKFSNGAPFTAQDVLFTICRTLNNETNVSQSYMDTTKLITDVQTPDDYTVIIKTGEPVPLIPADFTLLPQLLRGSEVLWHYAGELGVGPLALGGGLLGAVLDQDGDGQLGLGDLLKVGMGAMRGRS